MELPIYKVDDIDYENVVNYFNNNHDNRTSKIAKHFNLKKEYVNYILDLFLSKKRNYMGGKINYLSGINKENYNSIKLKVYNNNVLIGEFDNIKTAAVELGLKYPSSISRRLINDNEATIYHYSINKTYTYVKKIKHLNYG